MCRYCASVAMGTRLEWKESQIKSPSVEYLEQALRVNVGGVLVHWGPYGSGKSYALKDLTLRLQDNRNLAKYINARDFDSGVHGVLENFIKSELGLPLDKALGDLSRVIPPAVDGAIRPTIILDHIEDLVADPNLQRVITGIARDSRDSNAFRFLICCTSLETTKTILGWNGGHKFRLACWPDSGRWKRGILSFYLKQFKSMANVAPDQVEAIVACAVECGSPGKVEELICLSGEGRRVLSEAAGATWIEGVEVLRSFAIRDNAIRAPSEPVE